jgi:hypothetical protein
MGDSALSDVRLCALDRAWARTDGALVLRGADRLGAPGRLPAQRAAQLAHEAVPVHVDDLADERGTMAVHAPEAARAERADAVAEERDLHEGIAVPAEREHGLNVFRGGHRNPSIDPVPKIGRRTHGRAHQRR